MKRWSSFVKDLKFYISRQFNRPLVPPDYFMISLTDDCNLRCKMCGCPEIAQKYKGEELSTDEIKDIINQMVSWAKGAELVFSGGEPFIRNDILELIDYACSKYLTLSINTNGMYIAQGIADKLVSYPVYHLNFSLDGDTPEINDSIRGKGVFSRALQSICVLSEAKKKYKSEYPILSLNVTIMKENIKGISNIISLAKDYNVQNVFFQPVIIDNTYQQKRNEFISLNNAELNILVNALKKIKLQAKEKQIHVQMPSLSLLKEYFTVKDAKYSPRNWRCFSGYNRLSISRLGHIYSCYDSFGHIRESGIKENWYSDKASVIRKKIKKCKQFCLRTCYARPESESIAALIKSFGGIFFK